MPPIHHVILLLDEPISNRRASKPDYTRLDPSVSTLQKITIPSSRICILEYVLLFHRNEPSRLSLRCPVRQEGRQLPHNKQGLILG